MPVETGVHFTHHKAQFVLNLLETEGREADCVFYFDPDIVVRCRWKFFEEWVRDGVALCEDVNWRMPNDHPIRNKWRHYFCRHNVKLPNERHAYYNAGFVGTSREHRLFFQEWNQILALCDFDRSMLIQGFRTDSFNVGDQDALNITTMKTQLPLSTIGPDGMDFRVGGGGFVMCHALGSYKPWNHSYTWAAIAKGRRLARAERLFLEYADKPIRVFSRHKFLTKKLDRIVAGAVSRVVS